jgi:hypothetical protein
MFSSPFTADPLLDLGQKADNQVGAQGQHHAHGRQEHHGTVMVLSGSWTLAKASASSFPTGK